MAVAVLVLVSVVGAACGDDSTETGSDEPTPSPTNEASPTTAPSPSTEPPSTTAAPEPTEAPATTAPETTEAVDTEAPPAPTGLDCPGPGGGSGEIILQFDAPADPSDVDTIRVYVNDGSGFGRIVNTPIDGSPATLGTVWELVTSGSAIWTIGVAPVYGEVEVAVTFADAAGNESGWYPILINAGPSSC